MEAKDLMIGDWVYSRQGVPSRVTSITCDGIIETEDGVSNIEIAEPIPITPEILEKNGFVYNDLPFVQGWEQFGLVLYSCGNGYRISCQNNVALIIDSVHELQHLFLLCGIEKEIEL